MFNKIGIDLHGTMDKYPELFKYSIEFIKEISPNVEINVISGGETEEILEELTKLGYKKNIHFDRVISIVDFCMHELKVEMWQQPSPRTGKMNWYCHDDLWWASKAIACKKYELDWLLDDKSQYQEFFSESAHPTTFILGNLPYDDEPNFPIEYINFFIQFIRKSVDPFDRYSLKYSRKLVEDYKSRFHESKI